MLEHYLNFYTFVLMQKFLVIQTAFLGDVILATPVLSELNRLFPTAQIDVLVRKGNEGILANHPAVSNILIFNKKNGKIKALKQTLRQIRAEKYDTVINLHRFGSSGLLTVLSKAKMKIGFDKNPFSFLFTKKIPHSIGDHTHEVVRNLSCIAHLGAQEMVKPSVFPSQQNEDAISIYRTATYFVLAPASVWFTKQLPIEKWIELAKKLQARGTVYLVGGPDDIQICKKVIDGAQLTSTANLAGKLNLLDSCSLFSHATRCFVNDSGPLHMASAVNAPTTAFFCATVPCFGFGPLSTDSIILETKEALPCRPCGLHGGKSCPKEHFKCGEIDLETV